MRLENITQFKKTRSWERTNQISVKFVILVILTGNLLQLSAQEGMRYLIPSKIVNQSNSMGCDPSELIEVANEFLKLHASIQCVKTINPEIDNGIRVEMKKIKKETPYTLIVDYNECKFISLFPDKENDLLISPKWTIYKINLYPEITFISDFPSVSTTNKDETSTSKKPLLATYKDDNGKWIAMGPYITTDPYETEKQALGSLFYSDSDLTFICQRGKFKIYALNGKVEHGARDIRLALKTLGIYDIPE